MRDMKMRERKLWFQIFNSPVSVANYWWRLPMEYQLLCYLYALCRCVRL